jgi:hypothetical protein
MKYVKLLFYGVLLPAALVSGLLLGQLTWYAFRGITPHLPIPELWVVIGTCVVCLVVMAVGLILDIRGE